MNTITTSEARKNLASVLNRVDYDGEEIAIERHGRARVVLIGVDRLQELRDRVASMQARLDEIEEDRLAKLDERIRSGEEPLEDWEAVKEQLRLERQRQA